MGGGLARVMAGPGRVEKWGTRGSRAGRRCGARAEAWFISAHGLCVRAKRARGLPEDFRGERGGRGTAVALRPLPVATSQGVARTPHGRFSALLLGRAAPEPRRLPVRPISVPIRPGRSFSAISPPVPLFGRRLAPSTGARKYSETHQRFHQSSFRHMTNRYEAGGAMRTT